MIQMIAEFLTTAKEQLALTYNKLGTWKSQALFIASLFVSNPPPAYSGRGTELTMKPIDKDTKERLKAMIQEDAQFKVLLQEELQTSSCKACNE